MPEFLRGNSVAYLNPAPPLDIQGSSEYAISPPPRDWSRQRVESYLREYNRAMLKILTIHEALSRPLRPARVQQPLSVADPPRALVGHVRRGLGRLHRTDDARPGIRPGRPRRCGSSS